MKRLVLLAICLVTLGCKATDDDQVPDIFSQYGTPESLQAAPADVFAPSEEMLGAK